MGHKLIFPKEKERQKQEDPGFWRAPNLVKTPISLLQTQMVENNWGNHPTSTSHLFKHAHILAVSPSYTYVYI